MMKPKLLKENRRRTFKHTKKVRDYAKNSVILTDSEESENENEEQLRKENESENDLLNCFIQDVDNSFSREGKTLGNQENPKENRGIFENVHGETELLVSAINEGNTKQLNRPQFMHLPNQDQLFETDEKESPKASAETCTKKDKRKRQRNKTCTRESSEMKTFDEHTERDLYADVSEYKNVCTTEIIHEPTKSIQHEITHSTHAIPTGNFNSKLSRNLSELGISTSTKSTIPRGQSESFLSAAHAKESEKQKGDRRREYEEDPFKSRYAKQCQLESTCFNMSGVCSAESNNQVAVAVYKTLVRSKRKLLSLKELIDILSANKRFHSICESESELVSLLEQNDDKFIINYNANDEPLFSVRTTIAICNIYTNDPGHQHICHDLHICKYFLLSKCSLKKCKFGHKLSTNHNKSVFRSFSLNDVDMESKICLLRNIDSRNISTLPLICKFYNNKGGCKNANKCTHLHVCKNYINNDCKFGRECKRCHNILSKQPLSVLKRYGLNPNSSNFGKIRAILKDTLDDGDVLLKRHYQNNIEADQKSSTSSNDEYDYGVTDSSSSEGSSTADESDDYWKEQILHEYGHEDQQSSSEHDLDDYRHTKECGISLLNKHLRKKDGKNKKLADGYQSQFSTRKHDVTTKKEKMNDTKLIMTFESHIEDKDFMIRKVNGHFEISKESGGWHRMNSKEYSSLFQLHQKFISLAERIVNQHQ